MTLDTHAISNPGPALGTANKRLFARLYQHPMSRNMSWREVLALFDVIGTVEHAHSGDTVLRLNGQHQMFKPAHDKELGPEEIMSVRHLLSRAGWTDGAEVTTPAPPTDLVVVIDHADARIYAATVEEGAGPQELHHVQHSVDRARHDDNREETRPEDIQFFAAVAQALDGDGRIVVVGHAKGQSNEADHLMAYLSAHSAAVHSRIVREITSDLSHQTLRQLLAAARHVLQPVLSSAGKNTG